MREVMPVSDCKYGGQGRNRTADASLFRAALYHLSYLAISLGMPAATLVSVAHLGPAAHGRRG
jgi:hypothetical protein